MKPVKTTRFPHILIMGSAVITVILLNILKRIGGPFEEIVHGVTMMVSIVMTVIAWRAIKYINKNRKQTDKEPTQEK